MITQEVIETVEMLQGCGIDSFLALLERLHTLPGTDEELEELGVGHDRLLYLEREAARRTTQCWVKRTINGGQKNHKRNMHWVMDLLDEYGFRCEEFGVSLDYLEQCQHHVPMARYMVGFQSGHAYALRIGSSGRKVREKSRALPQQAQAQYA